MRARSILIGLLTGLAVGLAISSALGAEGDGRKSLDEAFIQPVAWLAAQVDLRYVEEVDLKELVVGTCQGMLAEIDPYSAYWPPEMLQELHADDGRVDPGFQVRFDPISKVVIIDDCIPGTSAFAEGLLPGDLVMEVEASTPGTAAFAEGLLPGDRVVELKDESTGAVAKMADMKTAYEVYKALRGEPGTELTVTVLRLDELRKSQVTVRRPGLEPPSAVLRAEVIAPDPRIGYVYLGHFGQGSSDELKQALNELRSGGIDGLLLDLRFNPGGEWQEARTVGGLFLDGDLLARIRGRAGAETELRARQGGADVDLPLVVLVNRFTAGWAELVAAALQDHRRAILVGEKTYGEAAVQTLMPSPFDDGTIRFTSARYYSPNGRTIDGEGTEPDVQVELSHEQTRTLAFHLVGAEEPPAVAPAPGESGEAGAGAGEKAEEKPPAEFRDTQLERALEIISARVKQVGEQAVPAAAG